MDPLTIGGQMSSFKWLQFFLLCIKPVCH